MNLSNEYEEHWSHVDAVFDFRPGMSPSVRPGIREPAASVTFSLAPIFSGVEAEFASGEAAINAEVLRAFVDVFNVDDALVALDWQHPGYWFRPHLHASLGGDWAIPPFPNGDYYFLFEPSLTVGTFGHPWEQSLCVVGDPMLESLAPVLSAWLPVLRRGGA